MVLLEFVAHDGQSMSTSVCDIDRIDNVNDLSIIACCSNRNWDRNKYCCYRKVKRSAQMYRNECFVELSACHNRQK